jgi:hypothetical protein
MFFFSKQQTLGYDTLDDVLLFVHILSHQRHIAAEKKTKQWILQVSPMRLIICWLLLPIHADANHDSDAAMQTGKFLCVSK